MTTQLLTPKDVAALLIMSERTVLDELRRKNLVGIKTPSGWRIDEDDLATYIASHKNVRPVRRSA